MMTKRFDVDESSMLDENPFSKLKLKFRGRYLREILLICPYVVSSYFSNVVNWNIIARVIWLWLLPDFINQRIPFFMELVLMDVKCEPDMDVVDVDNIYVPQCKTVRGTLSDKHFLLPKASAYKIPRFRTTWYLFHVCGSESVAVSLKPLILREIAENAVDAAAITVAMRLRLAVSSLIPVLASDMRRSSKERLHRNPRDSKLCEYAWWQGFCECKRGSNETHASVEVEVIWLILRSCDNGNFGIAICRSGEGEGIWYRGYTILM
ncbi:hypothetical protein E2542_SST20521 [Spatholobus suberectus]|nr:hypothetical protein E2542_SST20521 [Spatholobus suberectus]